MVLGFLIFILVVLIVGAAVGGIIISDGHEYLELPNFIFWCAFTLAMLVGVGFTITLIVVL